jgi:hypothetical protein
MLGALVGCYAISRRVTVALQPRPQALHLNLPGMPYLVRPSPHPGRGGGARGGDTKTLDVKWWRALVGCYAISRRRVMFKVMLRFLVVVSCR